jgi:hypothetical protein
MPDISLSNQLVIQAISICPFSLSAFLLEMLPHYHTTNSTVAKPIRQACRVEVTKAMVLVTHHSASQAALGIKPIRQACIVKHPFLAIFPKNACSHFNLLLHNYYSFRKMGIITLSSAFFMYRENSAGGICTGPMVVKKRKHGDPSHLRATAYQRRYVHTASPITP